jgi:predicted peroxiredoxin
MAKFNPNKVKAFQDFLELQTKLKSAQSSYDDAKRVEQVTDAIMTMGIEAGAAAQKHYIRSRNRKRLLVGLVIAGGAYLYKKMKDKEKETYAK